MFSFAVLDPYNDGIIYRREYNIALDILDTSKVGFITKAEFNCATGAAFNLLGTDRDGKLTRADFMPCFDMFDVDQDSLITEAEFNGKVCASSFSSAGLDSNNDSNIDLWE